MRGVVLILTTSLLVVLMLVATAMLRLTAAGRQMGGVLVGTARARLLARSGVEYGLARFSRVPDAPPVPTAANQHDDWTFRDPDGTSLERSLNPSYRHRRGEPYSDLPVGGNPPNGRYDDGGDAYIDLDGGGTATAWTGRLRGGHRPYGDTFSLAIRPSEGIHLNGGDPSAAAGDGYNATIRAMVSTLCEAIDREDGEDDDRPVGASDAARIYASIPPSGWSGWEEIRGGAGLTVEAVEALRPHVVLRARPDRKVIVPTAPAALDGTSFRTWAEYKMAHTHNGGPVPGWERVGGKVVGRSPVHLSWARRHRPVLVALLADLSGVYLDNRGECNMRDGDAFGIVRTATLTLDRTAADWSPGAASADECRRIADAIVAYDPGADVLDGDGRPDGEIDTWEKWNRFCDLLVTQGTIAGATAEEALAKADLLKSHFNPNGDLNKFNPDPILWRWVDKSDLLSYTTEFSLLPTGGISIESLGSVREGVGRGLASHRVMTLRDGPEVLRLTSQGEFVCEDLGDPHRGGDEASFRAPGFMSAGVPSFVSENRGMDRTWGHRIDARGTYAGTWLDGDSGGVSLQTYPEPVRAGGAAIAPAAYDGHLRLATLETRTEETYGLGGAATMTLLARFDDGLDLDVSAASQPAAQPDVVPHVPGAPLLDPSNPNRLYPDGVYSESGRSTAYLSLGNMHGMHGLLTLWAKPNYPVWDRWRRGHVWVDATNHNGVDPQSFWLTDHWSYGFGAGCSVFFDPTNGNEGESMFAVRHAVRREWTLVTVYWDFQGADEHATGELVVNDGAVANRYGPRDLYGSFHNPAAAVDLTAAPPGAPHKIVLGVLPPYPPDVGGSFRSFLASGADATFDEFAVYDAGQNEAGALPFAQARFRAGRYCRGWADHPPAGPLPADAAPAYVTPILDLPAGAVVQRVAWTWLRPASLPQDYAEVQMVDEAGTAFLWGEPASRASGARMWDPARPDWIVGRSPGRPFRARILFRRPAAPGGGALIDEDTPILESPIFDDLSIFYVPAGGPRLVSWTES